MTRPLFILIGLLAVVGCGSPVQERAIRPGLLDEAPAWVRFRDGFHLRLSAAAGEKLRWSFVDATGARHEGLFARVDDAWQADGSGLPSGTTGGFEIRGAEGLLCRRSLTLPVDDFEIPPRLCVGPTCGLLAWKLHGRMSLRLTWILDGRPPVERDVEGGGEDRLALPDPYHGSIAWTLAGAGRVLARGQSSTGPRTLLRLPRFRKGINGLDAPPLVMGEDLVTAWSQGYLAALRPEPTPDGTRLVLRWAWTHAAFTGNGSRHFRAIWSPAEGLVEAFHEDGRIFRLHGARRVAVWSDLTARHPGLSPAELLGREELRALDGGRGEGMVGRCVAASEVRVRCDGQETLLVLSPGDHRWVEVQRRAGLDGSWERVGRWDDGGLVDLLSVDPARVVLLLTRPDGRLFLRILERRVGGWRAREPVDLGLHHGAKSNGRAHCPFLRLPGRNVLLLGCRNRLVSIVLLPDGRSTVSTHDLPGDATLYVEGLVALSPHRAVALALEPRRTVGFLGEMTRKVSLVEIALEDPLKPVLRTFTIMGDNLRLQAAWHVMGAISSVGDRLVLVLGSELALTDLVAPFALRHRYQGAMHDDGYYMWATITGGRLFCFHKKSGVVGMDLVR